MEDKQEHGTEEIEQQPEEAQEQEQAQEAPGPDEETIAKALGFDSPEDVRKARNLKEWERKLRRQSMGLEPVEGAAAEDARQEAEPEGETPPAVEELTPEARRILEAEVERVLKARGIVDEVTKASTFAEMYAQQVEAQKGRVIDDWAKNHDDVDFEALTEIIDTHDLKRFASTPDGLQYALDTAYDIWRAKNLDSVVEKAVEERLSQLVKDGEKVVGVEPKRESVDDADTRDFDEIDDPAERYAWVKRRLSKG